MDNSVWEHATEKRQCSHWSIELVLSGALLREALPTILFLLRMPLYLISQISPKWRTLARITPRRREKVHIETWKLFCKEHYIWNLCQRFYLSRLTILYLISLVFAEIGLGTRYGEEKRFILKLGNCSFRSATYGTSINDVTFCGERSFTWSPKFFLKLINWTRNTLQSREKVHIDD